jgi:hypothetical protein
LNQPRINPGGFHAGSILPNTTNFDAYDEQFVHLRLEQIRPSFEFLEKVEELVETWVYLFLSSTKTKF